MLLITVEPKCRVNSDKNENQFRAQLASRPLNVFVFSSIGLSFRCSSDSANLRVAGHLSQGR